MSYFRKILPYVRPYWALCIASGLVTLLTSLAGLASPWPLKVLVDNVISGNPLPPPVTAILGPAAGQRASLLVIVVLAGLGLALVQNGLNVVSNYVDTTLNQRVVLDFRCDMLRHAQQLSVAYHDQVSTGRLMYGINFEADAAGGLVMAVQPLVQSALTLIGMVWILLRIDPVLALVSLAIVPMLYYSVGYYANRIQPQLVTVKNMEADCLSIIHEAMQMVRVITAFGREEHENRRYYDQGNRAVDGRIKVTFRQTLFSLAVSMTTAIGTSLVMGLGAWHALTGRLTTGDLLVVLAYVADVYKPLEAISYTIGSLQDRFVSLKMAFHIFETEPTIQEIPEPIHVDRTEGRVTFESVSFSYPGRDTTLRDITFEVQAGQVVAIVGPTGAGKTTLMSLLIRFYDPNEGRILLDGIDLRHLTLESLRSQISLVPQEPLLFTSTIADNIRYGRLEASFDEIVQAAKDANAHEFILRLPQSYDTAVGERGVQLSGGERQRICVARAFLKDAPVLILDEPTSSIDSRTESVILDALDRLMVGRTTFVIAHRLSTVRQADLILTVDGGRLVELGTHDELLELGGLYKQLYDVQVGQARRKRRLQTALMVEEVGEAT